MVQGSLQTCLKCVRDVSRPLLRYINLGCIPKDSLIKYQLRVLSVGSYDRINRNEHLYETVLILTRVMHIFEISTAAFVEPANLQIILQQYAYTI